jgi:hypothetical protein
MDTGGEAGAGGGVGDVGGDAGVTPSAGSPGTLPYDKDCAGADGWRYDDEQNPTRIEICPAQCTTIDSDPGGSIGVQFGCATVGNLR